MVRPLPRLRPLFERSAQAHPDVVHAKVDTDAEPELAATVGIRPIPTIMAFRDGVLVYSQYGAMPQTVLEGLIEQVKNLDMDHVRTEIAARKASATAFWGLVISAIVLAIRYLAGGASHHNRVGGGSAPAGGRADDVLAERYARGEIDDDEYQRRLTLIREHR